MFKSALFLLSAVSLFSQTLPAPPACLSGPVTQGSVTITCSLLDGTNENGASATGAPEMGDQYVFQVRLSSSDPDVIGFRVGLSYLFPAVDPTTPYTVWGSVGKSASLVPQLKLSPPSYRYTFVLGSPRITGIEVQELKASSSQKF